MRLELPIVVLVILAEQLGQRLACLSQSVVYEETDVVQGVLFYLLLNYFLLGDPLGYLVNREVVLIVVKASHLSELI